MTAKLAYLGTLAAPTVKGRRAVAFSISGSVELHHLVHSGMDSSNPNVSDWLWSVGINPDDAACALTADTLVAEVVIPALKGSVLVTTHEDLDIPFVDTLVRRLSGRGTPPVVSGLAPSGPLASAINGGAGRRSIALMASYEAALHEAASSPLVHHLDGTVDDDGALRTISVKGAFAHNSWTVSDDDDAVFVAMTLASLDGFGVLKVRRGPAAAALSRLAAKVGLEQSVAA